jgi:hypothetical protein
MAWTAIWPWMRSKREASERTWELSLLLQGGREGGIEHVCRGWGSWARQRTNGLEAC